jgi:hypothetical protein
MLAIVGYDRAMKCRAVRSLQALVLLGGVCGGQVPQSADRPSPYVEIKLPREVDSETFFARYVLDGQFGGWIQPRPGISAYFIRTSQQGHQAVRIKALLYAPGCAIQTLDLPAAETSIQRYSFPCEPVPWISISGTLARSDRLYGHDVKVQAKYVARWAAHFLGLDDDMITDIPVGETKDVSEGHFRLSLPDFSHDLLAGTPDHPGELQIVAKDRTSGGIVAQLVPTLQVARTRMGGLKILDSYPSEMVFAPCSANRAQVHDAMGFALRPDSRDACDH